MTVSDKQQKRRVPKTVLMLGTVSFLNDLSSEMIFPLLPVFLTGVLGAGAAALGIIEGIAEFISSILKIASGYWSDRFPNRKPLILGGYTTSGLLRPLIGIAATWPMVLLFRIGDRIGKGVRTSPRDALISDVTDENSRGMAYGIQRGMDHAGAVAGPLVASGLLFLGMGIRHVFLFAAIPAAVIVLIIIFGIKEPPRKIKVERKINIFRDWNTLGSNFHRMLLAILIFTLGNSTDAFLLLKLSHAGVNNEWIALLWSFHHVVKMGFAALGGWLSDRLGRKPLVISGWVWYALIYLGFGLVNSTGWLIAIFILYGIYFGLTEPTEKAWVADLAPSGRRAEAFGWYNGAVGIAALPASVLFGAIWTLISPLAAFATGGILALAAALLLTTVPSSKPGSQV